MPFVQISSNLPLTEAEKKNCLHTVSAAVAEILEKKEDYVMTAWTAAKMTMGGSDAPAAMVDVRAIRLGEDAPESLSRELCERIQLSTGILKERIFINFTDLPPEHWGWNGKTFA